MILLCYDGSEDAQAAVSHTARLFGALPVTVATVFTPYVDILTMGGFGLPYTPPTTDVPGIDAALEQRAMDTAQQGAEQLRSAGLTVEARTVRQGADIAETILGLADELDADAIVLGTRGNGRVKSMLLGSVSHAVVQRADRPVVVVPAASVARARRRHAEPSSG